MNREELKELGLSDEQIDKVMANHGKVVNDIKAKADKVDGLESQIKDYKQQITDRDTQLKELGDKVKGNEELTTEIDRLKQENEDNKNEYEKQLQDKTFNYELEKALSAQQAKNPRAVKALLDKEAIKLDGDKLLGLDEQLTALKESDGYLFGEEQPAGLGGRNPVVTGKGNQATGLTKEDFQGMGYQERVELYQNDPETYKQLNN